MPDFFDEASDHENELRELALATARGRPLVEAEATGACLWCGEPQADPAKRWCDKDCLTDWDEYRAASARAGAE